MNYIFKKDNHPCENSQYGDNNHPCNSPQGGNSHRVEDNSTNALSTNNQNALSTNNQNALSTNNSKEKYSDDIKEIVAYLNEKLGTKYRDNTKSIIKDITARLKEEYTLSDFKVVIDKKTAEWTGTEQEKYLRPETLFGNKFDGYLNQKESNPIVKNNYNNYSKPKELSIEEKFAQADRERNGDYEQGRNTEAIDVEFQNV